MIVKDGVLIKVEESDIVNGTFSSWEGITSIGEGAFSSLHNLIEIEIPPKIKEIKDGTFVVCSILKKVVLPPQLEKIGNNAFKQCTRLKELDIPKTVTSIGEYAFMYCFEMKEIKIPEGVRTIEKSTFEYCPSLEKIVFTKKMEKIDNSAFMSCKNVNTLEFKEGLDITNINIIDNFENLKTMIIQDKEFDFSKYKQFIIDDVEKCRKQIIKMQLLLDENFKMNSLIKFPIAFLDSFDKENLQMILTKKNQKHFKQIYNECIKDKKNYIENLIDFYKFAYSIGCFNDEEIVIDSKKINLAQKASVFLKQILDDNIFSISDSHYYFDSLILCKYNPELLKFMTHKEKVDGKEHYTNFKYLLDKGRTFSHIVNKFDEIQNEIVTDEKGRIIQNPAIKRKIESYLDNLVYDNIKLGNHDIVDEFKKFSSISQQHFDEAQNTRKAAKKTSSHIVGEQLKEDEIIETIEKLKREISDKTIDANNLLDELYEKEFTYEWLDKHDPKNFTLGLYCDCCASIVSAFYGKDIMKDSIVREDVQNLVIKDSKGQIVAKATVYVNKKRGYAVFNDIEMNRDYGNEVDEDDKSDNKQREKIYKAFKRGVNAFVEKYNEKNKRKPITQVNVGWGFNRLKQTIKKIEEKSSTILNPIDSFEDAKKEQWIIYKAKK